MGGIEALSTLVAGFPADLDAAVLVVQHTAPGLSLLPEILSRAGPLRATHALHGEAIEKGRIYVAPPDNHMLVRAGAVSVGQDEVFWLHGSPGRPQAMACRLKAVKIACARGVPFARFPSSSSTRRSLWNHELVPQPSEFGIAQL